MCLPSFSTRWAIILWIASEFDDKTIHEKPNQREIIAYHSKISHLKMRILWRKLPQKKLKSNLPLKSLQLLKYSNSISYLLIH